MVLQPTIVIVLHKGVVRETRVKVGHQRRNELGGGQPRVDIVPGVDEAARRHRNVLNQVAVEGELELQTDSLEENNQRASHSTFSTFSPLFPPHHCPAVRLGQHRVGREILEGAQVLLHRLRVLQRGAVVVGVVLLVAQRQVLQPQLVVRQLRVVRVNVAHVHVLLLPRRRGGRVELGRRRNGNSWRAPWNRRCGLNSRSRLRRIYSGSGGSIRRQGHRA